MLSFWLFLILECFPPSFSKKSFIFYYLLYSGVPLPNAGQLATYNFVQSRYHYGRYYPGRLHFLEPVPLSALPADVQEWLVSHRYRVLKRSFLNCQLDDAIRRGSESSDLLTK